jgi:hypothetical protein
MVRNWGVSSTSIFAHVSQSFDVDPLGPYKHRHQHSPNWSSVASLAASVSALGANSGFVHMLMSKESADYHLASRPGEL